MSSINASAAGLVYSSDSANQIVFQTGGTTALTIDSSQNINVTGNITSNGTGPLVYTGNIVANSGTVSTSTTTGTLVANGGIGISGNIYVSNIFPSANNAGGIGLSTLSNQFFANSYITNSFVGNVIAPFANANPSLGTSTAMFLNQYTVNNYVANVIAPIANNIVDIGSVDRYYEGIFTVNATIANSIIPTANTTVNIGSAQKTFNNIYGVNFLGTSTTAKYADLAEMYHADNYYAPGTVMIFGGDLDVKVSTQSHDTRIAGVVSTNPAYLMNDNFEQDNWVPVALTGRVPCNVQGPVQKGDLLVSSDVEGVAQKLDKSKYEVGCIIGKSLEIIIDDSVRKIEIAVGRY